MVNIHNIFNAELGVNNGRLSPLSRKPNCVSTQADSADKRIAAIEYRHSLSDQMQRIIRVIESMPGAKIKQCEGGYLYAVFTSRLMRFKDDVEIFLDDESKTLHFRSASRVGYSDLGVNRKRYETFVSMLA
jgi:uncharacterized protein (DUF1499 family)